ncbi:MAG TPA: hypothetical protein VFS94_06590 [Gemmatimonadales bacterium]|nr:hypothetical protein [Gemmatimonadales bacterium]
MPVVARSLLCLLLVLGVACGDETAPPDNAATTIAEVDGSGQAATVGTALAAPLRVVVRDAQSDPVAGVDVVWTASLGGGSVSAGVQPTGADGISSVNFTLGPLAGQQQVTAAVVGLDGSPVAFTATASPVAAGDIALVKEVPIPPHYGIHDTFVRDGLAFVFAWDEGVYIFDVGNGMSGGSPSNPVQVSKTVTAVGANSPSPSVHNGWWFHAPGGEKRYLFVGEEGPGLVGTSSTGDLHVLDVSNLAAPLEVATYHHPDVDAETVGIHNFWMDEPNQILYAAYYNGGVVSFDVSGTLSGDLSSRVIDEIRPGGAGNTFVWGVMLGPDGDLYVSDMLSGFWQLGTAGGAMSPLAGGNNVTDRFGSDLWIHPDGAVAYTGTWGGGSRMTGNQIKVWSLDGSGAPTLSSSVTVAGVSTVSDVEVSSDGSWMLVTSEYGDGAGLHLYDLANPLAPVLIDHYPVASPSGGLHTGTTATIAGRTYVFAARDPAPGGPALMIFDVTDVIP